MKISRKLYFLVLAAALSSTIFIIYGCGSSSTATTNVTITGAGQ